VLLPGYEKEQFEERNGQLFFLNGRGDESVSARSSDTSATTDQTPLVPPQAVLYKQVINGYTQQTLNVYFMPGTTLKPTKTAPNQEVGPCIHSRGFDEARLLRDLPGKSSFEYAEGLHINCSGGYFFVDQPLQMNGTLVHFDDRYDTGNIDRLMDVIEVVEPAVTHETRIPVSGSNP
jgi:hypothetical protein